MLKLEAKSFRDARQDIVRIQKVIWDHLLAFKGEIIQKQTLFLYQSIPAVPIPPGLITGHKHFLKKLGEFPGVGTKKEGKCPAPGIVAFLHFCSFFINQ